MKYVFLTILAILSAASLWTWSAISGSDSDRPILFWVTDPNPAREEQIHAFHLWQVAHGRTGTVTVASPEAARAFLADQTPLFARAVIEVNRELSSAAGAGGMGSTFPLTLITPAFELRLDSGNAEVSKRIIQGVSGVGGDVMDGWSGGSMWQLQGIGLLRDVTDDARRLGFGPEQTFPAATPEIAIPAADGAWQQFQFPCNINAPAFVVNLDVLAQAGLPAPPRRWTIAEFETYGRAYVARANATPGRPRVFFADAVDRDVLRRAFGASELNETMTACTIDDPRSVAALAKCVQWQDVDRLIPSAADRAGFASDSGYGGQGPQLFNAGTYAMMWTGRYMLIQFRRFNVERVAAGGPPLRLGLSEMPHEVFPNTSINTRAAAVYAGGQHQDLAVLFLAYLASEEYNQQVVRDADALPPNPKFTRGPAYHRPTPDPARGIYPETEYPLHASFLEMAETLSVAGTYSPFILQSTIKREVGRADEAAFSHLKSPAAAMADARQRIDAEIARNLSENPKLQALYGRKRAQQRRLDEMTGKLAAFSATRRGAPIPAELKIPASLLDNPFHRAFYAHLGWTSDDVPSTQPAAAAPEVTE